MGTYVELNILKLWLLLATQGFTDFNLDATEKAIDLYNGWNIMGACVELNILKLWLILALPILLHSRSPLHFIAC